MGHKEVATVEVTVALYRESEGAWGVLRDDAKPAKEPNLIWLPKSQVSELRKHAGGKAITVTIPEWLAEKHDLEPEG